MAYALTVLANRIDADEEADANTVRELQIKCPNCQEEVNLEMDHQGSYEIVQEVKEPVGKANAPEAIPGDVRDSSTEPVEIPNVPEAIPGDARECRTDLSAIAFTLLEALFGKEGATNILKQAPDEIISRVHNFAQHVLDARNRAEAEGPVAWQLEIPGDSDSASSLMPSPETDQQAAEFRMAEPPILFAAIPHGKLPPLPRPPRPPQLALELPTRKSTPY